MIGLQYKQHFKYFEEYFQAIKAETILTEFFYVSKDYLEDYSAYYVRCFTDYGRSCIRLHFFSHSFDRTDFEDLLSSGNNKATQQLRNSYLGFLTIKPLPKTFIGKTCLKVYSTNGGKRNFKAIREYKSNLCGIELNVETLAFQEQD